MRKFRFYTDRKNLRPGSSIMLDDFEAKHARKTLRLKKNDEIFVFNGEKEFKAKLTDLRNDLTMAEIVEEMAVHQLTHQITVMQALTKASSFEEVLEKTTELGISEIIPLQTEYSVVRLEYVVNKYERWKKIIISACKQSERIIVPKLQQGITFEHIAEIKNNYDVVFVCATEDENTVSLQSVINVGADNGLHLQKQKSQKIAYIIGPEGGFSPHEIAQLKELQIPMISLSDSILRSETAAVVALAQILYQLQQAAR